LNIPDNNDINIYEASRNISLEDINNFFLNLALSAEEFEKNQSKIIQNLDEYNQVFDVEIEKALINSIFEYKIINIFVVDKDNENYKIEKSKCLNTKVRILFHGTKLDAITGILSTQFHNAKMHIFGIGTYFTDQLDYAWYYAGEGYREQCCIIPKVGATFSIVASEIYYDNAKVEKVFNAKTRDQEVQKNGIRCTNVNYNTKIMKEEELKDYKEFIGNEFLITDKSQIMPLYGITLKRIEYLVIWRDYNFNDKNPNSYEDLLFNKMQEFHRQIKRIISSELNSKTYYLSNSNDSLELIKRKKFNKIIIITNASNEADQFITEARKIIGSNIIVGVSAYNVRKHINWIKDMKNIILLNGIEFHKKFLRNVLINNQEGLDELRNEINNYYKEIPNFKLKKLKKDCLYFPNFKEEGLFEELNLVDNNYSNCLLF
jgi:hypothetical protein